MPRTISDLNSFDTANNSQIYFLRHFVEKFLFFYWKLILNFFLCLTVITCCWGGTLKPVLHSRKYRRINVHVLYTLSIWNFWFSVQIFFSEIYLSAIFEIFIEIFSDIFFRSICVCVVSVNTNVFYSCCDDISTFPALFEIFFVDLFDGSNFGAYLLLPIRLRWSACHEA